jgi:hypothetical protein
VSGQVSANGYLLWVVYPATLTCGVLLSDTCWGGVVGLSAIEFEAHITAGTFDVGVTPTQGEPIIGRPALIRSMARRSKPATVGKWRETLA